MAVTVQDVINGVHSHGYSADLDYVLLSIINTVYLRIAGYRRWPWLETAPFTVTATLNTREISNASLTTLLGIDSVRLHTGAEFYNLKYLDHDTLFEKSHMEQTSDLPRYWTFHDNRLYLHPRPDRAYTVDVIGLARPTLVDDATDTMLIPDQYIPVLVWGTLTSLAYRERDWGAWQSAKQEYTGALSAMSAELGLTQRQDRSEVARSSFWEAYE